MQTETSHLTPETIDHGLGLSRNSIIDKFILASSLFGLLYMGVTLWRDLYVGILSTNSIINLITAIIPTCLWFVRHQVDFGSKAAILFSAYLVTGVKSIFIFGTSSNSTLIFLCFCTIILALSVEFKWSVVLCVVLSLVIPFRAYLHFSEIYPIDFSTIDKVTSNSTSWLQLYVTFVLTAAIVIFGTSQLRLEVNKYISLLQKSISKLESVNFQLTSEIELKNAYQDDLLVSSRKFESLFESSRDGVLLLNSKAKVIEANSAICEIVGYSLEDLRHANSIFELIDSPFLKAMEERFQKQVRGEWKPVLMETTLKRKDGQTVPVEINSNVILTDEEVLVIGTVRDISFRKQLENEKFNAALEAEERERSRFSKDLHDDLGPAFSTLNLYLQTLSKKESDAGKKEILDKLSDIVDLAVKQVREISHNLSPYLLKDAGLVKAIATHLTKIKDNEALQVEFVQQLEVNVKTPHNVEIVLYRIFLELLNNTIKHSGADKIKISIACSSRKFCFVYIDNGKGFDLDHELESKSGIGLRNIENRVKSLGGTIDFIYQNNEMITDITIPA